MQLVETIRFEKGKLHLLDLHQERFDRSRSELFEEIAPVDLFKAITIPELIDPWAIYKVRVVYSESIKTVEWHRYEQKAVRSFRMVIANDIDYHLKFTDRSRIDGLTKQANGCDSIIIVKNGMITDSAYANIIFFDGKQWITPSTPLLKGVMRESLLRNGLISEEPIRVDDLSRFTEIKLINAMIPMDRFESIAICSIR